MVDAPTCANQTCDKFFDLWDDNSQPALKKQLLTPMQVSDAMEANIELYTLSTISTTDIELKHFA